MQVIYIDLNYLVDKGSIRQEANRQNSTQEEWDKPPSYLKCRFVPSLSQDQVGPKQGEGGWEQNKHTQREIIKL